MSLVRGSLRPTGVAIALVAVTLSVLLVVARGTGVTAPVFAELLVAMLWLSLVVHAGAVLAIGIAFAVLSRVTPRIDSRAWPSFLASGLVGADLGWALWNRLGMAHQYASVRPFLTWTGVAENLGLVAIVGLCALGGLAAAGTVRRRWLPTSAASVSAIALGLLAWNASEESTSRDWPLARVRDAAEAARELAGPMSVAGTPILVLAIDGLSWGSLGPLVEGGHVPNLTRLVADGAIGLLHNDDESLSARVWNTIFSGRTPRAHGVGGFTKLVLPRSGESFPDLLLHRPGIDSFYGLSHLLSLVPSAGQWRVEQTGSQDRRVKMLWDVLSESGRSVVVANVMSNVPVHPVRGAMVNYRDTADDTLMFPAELARRWQPAPRRDLSARTREGFADHHRRLLEEIAFTRDLFVAYDVDVGIYYTHFLDTASHANWDFYSRGEFLLDDLPAELDDDAWKAVVLAHVDDPAFRAYMLLDEAIGFLLDTFPTALVVVCSDHGWTYSGYEHFGSPDGVLIVSGRGTRAGAILPRTHVADVTPTILGLCGVPLSAELEGRCLEEAFVAPPETLVRGSYGRPERSGPSRVEDGEELARLRALGYVN